MSGFTIIVVRWLDETDQSQSAGLRDAGEVVQTKEDETKPLY